MTAREAWDRAEIAYDARMPDDTDGAEGCACGVEEVLDSGRCLDCEIVHADVPWWLPSEGVRCDVVIAASFVAVVVAGIVGQGRVG